jgi:hypothetical protein
MGWPAAPHTSFRARFTPQMLTLLGKRPDETLGRNFHMSPTRIRNMREKLGIPKYAPPNVHRWTQGEIALLGKLPDVEVARRMGLAPLLVCRKRRRLGIVGVRNCPRWTAKETALLGKMPDRELAKRLGIPVKRVKDKRRRMGGIPACRVQARAGTPPEAGQST